MKQIYKITFPNRKIYVGKDLTGTLTYFGSMDSDYVEADFGENEKRSFSITKEILWESSEATDSEVNSMEVKYIRELESNNPSTGYNKWPKWHGII